MEDSLHAEGNLSSGPLLALFLADVTHRLAVRFPHVDSQLLSDAVTDAFLDYSVNPSSFDVHRGVPFGCFLLHAASRNARNFLRTEQRRLARDGMALETFGINFGALGTSAGNTLWSRLVTEELIDGLLERIPSEVDKKVFQLELSGERKTVVYAEAMGIAEAPTEIQQHDVKCAKDRIHKMLRRSLTVHQFAEP